MTISSTITFDYRIILFGLPFIMLAAWIVKFRQASGQSAIRPWFMWIALAYGLLVWLMMAALPGMILNAASMLRVILGIIGGLLAGYALWRMSRSNEGRPRLDLRVAAVTLLLAVPAICLTAPFFEKYLVSSDTDVSLRYPIEAFIALCGLIVWISLVHYQNLVQPQNPTSMDSVPARGYLFTATILLASLAYAGMDRHTNIKPDLNPEDAPQYSMPDYQDSGKTEDRAKQEWKQMMASRQQTGIAFFKGMALVLIFLIVIYQCRNIFVGLRSQSKQKENPM